MKMKMKVNEGEERRKERKKEGKKKGGGLPRAPPSHDFGPSCACLLVVSLIYTLTPQISIFSGAKSSRMKRLGCGTPHNGAAGYIRRDPSADYEGAARLVRAPLHCVPYTDRKPFSQGLVRPH